MPEFLNLLSPSDALNRLLSNLSLQPQAEEISTLNSLGRVTIAPIFAPQPLPAFPRSTVDGYAVRASDTFGTSDSLPCYLKLAGEVLMGSTPGFSLNPAECGLIHTGGMLPQGADAVVMIEHTQVAQSNEIEVFRAAAVGENVLKVGEDVARGEQVIAAGTRLRPPEIGGLMALGITRLQVACRTLVGILSSGDEIVPPKGEAKPGQVRDVNSYSLSALVEQAGGIPVRYGIVPDQAEIMRQTAERALVECDMLVITAGSSASVRDLTSQVIDSLGKPGILVHGVDVRPGKPTILAACAAGEERNSKAVIGLPGNPVSALVIAYLFVIPVIDALQGLHLSRPRPVIQARLTINLPSQAGREDWIPVRLISDRQEYQVEPVFGKSNLIFSLARADGLMRIPSDATGLNAGSIVEVLLV